MKYKIGCSALFLFLIFFCTSVFAKDINVTIGNRTSKTLYLTIYFPSGHGTPGAGVISGGRTQTFNVPAGSRFVLKSAMGRINEEKTFSKSQTWRIGSGPSKTGYSSKRGSSFGSEELVGAIILAALIYGLLTTGGGDK